jgi:hypothetical protein
MAVAQVSPAMTLVSVVPSGYIVDGVHVSDIAGLMALVPKDFASKIQVYICGEATVGQLVPVIDSLAKAFPNRLITDVEKLPDSAQICK